MVNFFGESNHELNLESNDIDLSRNSILINKNIGYKRRMDLENKNICDIVIEINSKGNKNILLVGSYREWQKPKMCNIQNSKSLKSQVNRFNITMQLWENLCSENKDLIILSDDNIDSSLNSNHNKRHNIKSLFDILSDAMNRLNIIQCNKKMTRITNHQAPSCIDKIYSNVSHKITNIQTTPSISSDHHYVSATYNSKEPIYNPKFFSKRNFDLLTKKNIENYMNYSNLDTIFHSQDPDYIANTIQLELNTIYNILAPSKLVQFKSNHIPYYISDIREKLKGCDNLLTQAISSKSKEDWRNFRNKGTQNGLYETQYD